MDNAASATEDRSESLRLRLSDVRFLFFFAALVIYGLWGTPTPDDPGWVEGLIALSLIFAVGPSGFVSSFLNHAGEAWRRAGLLFLLFGLSVPLAVGLIHKNDPALIVRDIIPFLFLMLPLLMARFLETRPAYIPLVTVAVAGIGLCFSVRMILPIVSGLETIPWPYIKPEDPFYLANAPTVLFAALLLLGSAGCSLSRISRFSSFASAVLMAGLAFIPIIAMALMMQRASIGMIILAVIFWGGILLILSPRRLFVPLIILGLSLTATWPFLQDILAGLARKTGAVGLNMRFEEAAAVVRVLEYSFLDILFGKGWGATFASPAVGGITVNFTHNFVTTYWLKAGLLGVILAVAYVGLLGWGLVRLAFVRPVVAVALAAPFVIDMFLYASFKSLDFGLILLLIPLWLGHAGARPKVA